MSEALDALEAAIIQYLEWMEVHHFSGDTVTTRRDYLGYFHEWCRERGLERPADVTRPVLERWQKGMWHYRKRNGQPLSIRTQHTRLRAVKSFFQWLARQHRILYNPASELVLPRMDNRLPKYVLTAGEAELVLIQPDVETAQGLRDRAALEVLYLTGMRRMELAALKVWDIDSERGTVTIRQGKGRKDRVIPIAERALEWIAKYLDDARCELLTGSDDGTVFVNDLGAPFERLQLTGMVRKHLQRSGIAKTGGCHLFRHTLATLMLENGADIRVIQQMLGHTRLDTTELYTRVSVNLLKQVYSVTHPGTNVKSDAAE